jgi:hypothetical protein
LVRVVQAVLRQLQQVEVKGLLQYFHLSLLLVVDMVQNAHPMAAMAALAAVQAEARRILVERAYLEKVLLVEVGLLVAMAVAAAAVVLVLLV